MSRPLGLALLRADYHDARIPVMEHLGGLSRQVVTALTGQDPLTVDPQGINAVYQELARVLEVDLLWGGGLPGPDAQMFDWDAGPTVQRNRAGQQCVQWGVFGTVHAEDGRHFHHIPKPTGVAEALAFDPDIHFKESVAELTARFTRDYQTMRERCGDTCQPIPHHYTTAFHFPLAIFGFELLCEAGLEEKPFSQLMERFAAVSTRIATAWANVPNLPGFILHDDLTMTAGPIFAPDWYRRHIFPHYPAIFAPFKQRGIPIIFTSDGDCSCFVDDIFHAGADGLNFEPMVDLARLVRDYPDKILIGNLSSHILAHGSPAEIIAHTRERLSLGAPARRFVINVAGGLTHDIPLANLQTYLDLRRELARNLRA